jgi:O-antigen ligase
VTVATVSPVRLGVQEQPKTSTNRDWRLHAVWGLLFLNVLQFQLIPTVIPIPNIAGKLITQVSLLIALVLALTINRRVIIRPNALLSLLSVMAVVALALSVREFFGLGSVIRAFRLLGFLSVLWLLSPWWGRRDMLLLKSHIKWLMVALSTVVLGIFLKPGAAFAEGRLTGTIWPIPPTQVAHYAAVGVGITAVLWFSGLSSSRRTGVIMALGLGILILTRTRTALFAMVAGVLVAGLSLFIARSRVRQVLLTGAVVVLVAALTVLPLLTTFLERGQNLQQLTEFTGRTNVWHALLNQPRTPIREIFGYGLSNKSYTGLPIDSSWIATYQDEGLFGDVISGLVLLTLGIIAFMRPRVPQKAIALFLITYCLVASFTEVGLGDASPYLLDLTVAASLLVAPPALARGT